MHRRGFLAGVAGGLFAGMPAALAGPPQTPRMARLSTYVTNVRDLLGPDTVAVQPGARLLLTRERGRAYDPGSIGVAMADATLIGYLPSAQSRVLAPMMDAGIAVSAVVTRVKAGPRPGVDIEVMIEGPPLTTGRLS